MTSLEVDELEALRSFVGQTVAVSDWLEVTQDRIDRFAEVTNDCQWIHTDAARAPNSSYGGTVAHGFLIMSLLSQFARRAIRVRAGYAMVVNYGLNRVRFPTVRAGERICTRFSIASVDDRGNAVQVVLRVVVEREHVDKPCCVAEWVVRYYSRDVEAARGDVLA